MVDRLGFGMREGFAWLTDFVGGVWPTYIVEAGLGFELRAGKDQLAIVLDQTIRIKLCAKTTRYREPRFRT